MTRAILAAGLGSLIGLGVFVLVSARRGRLSMFGSRWYSRSGLFRHVAVAVSVIVVVRVATGWTLVSLTAGVVGGLSSSALGPTGRRRDDRMLVEAIAVWTEQLRDMLAGSSGLEQAVAATAPHAPTVLRRPLERLVASVSYAPLDQALDRFAREVDHPTADFVVAALSTAATRQVRELGALLGHLASCAHAEARMYTRIWVGRSRTRSAVRIIATVVVLFVLGLLFFSPGYLEPYRTPEGQVVLSVIVLVFFAAIVLMQRFAVVSAPERFIGRRTEVTS
jgi:tight adherence protein B